ncbi:MAG: hypothetical protein EU531_00705 [Promethearchaeota archaeon]|nr:MAG: hypothetical protein EU531_00705 [Candidatus Lokiarchaeota archaeon]
MALNWNIEVIIDFITAIFGIILTIITYYSPKAKKIKSLFFIRLGFILFWVFILTDGLSFLFLNKILGLLSGLLIIPATLFIIIGLNYTMKENIYSYGLIIVAGLSSLLIYSGFLPGAVYIEFQSGYLRVAWGGLFGILGMVLTGIAMLYLFYWGVRTWINAPFLIKKEALIFFLGILTIFPFGFLFYLLYIFEPIFILICDISIAIGTLIISLVVIREPKLLYILPYTIYRIVVKNKDGVPLYYHDWSESVLNETIFTGFLNAVQLMSEEVMNIGGLLDINLKEGILILKESKSITVGLVSSKSSKLLRDSVIKFTADFEKKFERELKKSITDPSQYENAFELIEKYFSNFPYKIIESKKQPLLLTGRYLRIPLELENKLRKIFTDEEDYESIKAELIKSPLSFTSEFIRLHDELKDEMKQISNEDLKLLDED